MGRRSGNRVLRTISLWTLLAGLFVGLTTDGLASGKWDGQWIGNVVPEDPEGCKFVTKPEKISVAGDKIVFRTSSGGTTGQLEDDGSFVEWVPVDVVNTRYVSEYSTEAKIEGKISDGLLEGVMHAIYGFYNWSCTASVKFAKDGSVLAEALRTGKDPKLVALERRIAALTSAPAPDNREAKAEEAKALLADTDANVLRNEENITTADSNAGTVVSENVSVEGKWVGKLVTDNGSCATESLIKAEIDGGEIRASFEVNGGKANVSGTVSPEGDVSISSLIDVEVSGYPRTREMKISGTISGNLLDTIYEIDTNQRSACIGSFKIARKGSIPAEAILTGKDPNLIALERRIAAVTSAPGPNNREGKAEVERLQNLRLQEEERLAELRAAIAALQNRQSPKSKFNIPANVNFGDYHALVIGINDYKNLTPLKTAVADAEAIADVLSEKYGFQVTKLINPSRGDILDALDDLRATLKFKDNLLVYYAGHGWLDEKGDEGYWLPANAKKDRRSRWVSNASITTTLRALEAKHVMVIADSCYSGRLVRDANIKFENADTPEYLSQMSRKKARVVITSGGLEPVEDGRGKHSPFARAFLRALNENEGVLDGSKLFSTIRRPVMVSANQTPQYSDVRKAGHDGGDFLFVRQK